MVTCRKQHKTKSYVGARKKVAGSLFKAIDALATDDSCRGYLKEAHDALKKAGEPEDKDTDKTGSKNKYPSRFLAPVNALHDPPSRLLRYAPTQTIHSEDSSPWTTVA